MNKGGRWILGLFVLAAGAVAWGVLADRREEKPTRGAQLGRAGRPEPEPPSSGSPTSGQRTLVAVPVAEGATTRTAEPPAPAIAGEASTTPRSPLARDLDDVAASFLTRQPRVTDLLDLVEQMASMAVVEPDSVTIQRGPDDALRSARGSLAIGDLRGTFLVDADGYRIQLRSGSDDAAWSQRDIQISFEEEGDSARGCNVVVQFQPGTGDGLLTADGERLVGWSVATTPEKGTTARPLTLSLADDGWRIVDSTSVQAQDFSWVAGIEGFTAWLRLLAAQAAGPASK